MVETIAYYCLDHLYSAMAKDLRLEDEPAWERAPKRLNELNKRGLTLLSLAARDGNVKVAEKLIHLGALIGNIAETLPNAICDPLHLALLSGSVKTCQLLYEKGAPLDTLDKDKQGMSEYAIRSGNLKVFSWLHNLTPNAIKELEPHKAFRLAVKSYRSSMLIKVLELYKPTQSVINSIAPLHLLIMAACTPFLTYEKLTSFKLLLYFTKVDTDHLHENRTPLLLAFELGHALYAIELVIANCAVKNNMVKDCCRFSRVEDSRFELALRLLYLRGCNVNNMQVIRTLNTLAPHENYFFGSRNYSYRDGDYLPDWVNRSFVPWITNQCAQPRSLKEIARIAYRNRSASSYKYHLEHDRIPTSLRRYLQFKDELIEFYTSQ